MTLTEFLLARIAEDEATARRATPSRWAAETAPNGSPPMVVADETIAVADTFDKPHLSDATHIARHDPARVLAECEAKRRIVEDFQVLDADYKVSHSEFTEARRFQAAVAMGHLATTYADHPDYLPEWRP